MTVDGTCMQYSKNMEAHAGICTYNTHMHTYTSRAVGLVHAHKYALWILSVHVQEG
jgi:hypothetical protein